MANVDVQWTGESVAIQSCKYPVLLQVFDLQGHVEMVKTVTNEQQFSVHHLHAGLHIARVTGPVNPWQKVVSRQ